jgi:hypothetical protein
MSAPVKPHPLADALRLLAELLGEAKALRVRIESRVGVAELVVRPAASTACPAGEQAGRSGKMFSPIEESILAAATDDWQTSVQLAEKTQQTRSSWFSALLANLVERECLEGGHNGYRLPRKEGQS